jgi:hypothetical protein
MSSFSENPNNQKSKPKSLKDITQEFLNTALSDDFISAVKKLDIPSFKNSALMTKANYGALFSYILGNYVIDQANPNSLSEETLMGILQYSGSIDRAQTAATKMTEFVQVINYHAQLKSDDLKGVDRHDFLENTASRIENMATVMDEYIVSRQKDFELLKETTSTFINPTQEAAKLDLYQRGIKLEVLTAAELKRAADAFQKIVVEQFQGAGWSKNKNS